MSLVMTTLPAFSDLSDVAVAAGGGWKSTKTLKIYQQIDPASVLAAVVNAR